MPPFGPISRRKLIHALRQAGFEGPFTGTDHQIMLRGNITVKIPNPHVADIGRHLLAQILKQAGISRHEWLKL
ncbi:MAG TPA: type II toxin-antitoxin system HicA family toxin [Tepidisphaeraceae bacterium]|jgi:predicted RNA binding protein YcfA (HicA-like mRNA interferase family)